MCSSDLSLSLILSLSLSLSFSLSLTLPTFPVRFEDVVRHVHCLTVALSIPEPLDVTAEWLCDKCCEVDSYR